MNSSPIAPYRHSLPVRHQTLVRENAGKSFIDDSAFALVELGMVLLCFSLLFVLVLPCLAKSGDYGRRTFCTNNLRQLGIAAVMYGNDHLDYLAPPNWDGGYTFFGQFVQGWLYYPTNSLIPDPGPGGAYATNPAVAYRSGLWFDYVRNPQSFLCPLAIQSKTYITPGLRNNRLSTYGMNGAVCSFGEIDSRGQFHASCKITDAWSPQCFLLWEPDENARGPGNPGGFDFNDGSNFPDDAEGVGCIHTPTGGEVLSVGGSVTFVTFQRIRTEENGPGRSLGHWNPFSSNGW